MKKDKSIDLISRSLKENLNSLPENEKKVFIISMYNIINNYIDNELMNSGKLLIATGLTKDQIEDQMNFNAQSLHNLKMHTLTGLAINLSKDKAISLLQTAGKMDTEILHDIEEKEIEELKNIYNN